MASSAHPRMRGEHRHLLRVGIRAGGSSPHARGAPSHRSRTFPFTRLIPACAGSTLCEGGHMLHGVAHPRMRGEHDRPVSAEDWIRGSSPHARGARWCRASTSQRVRLIPACAGSTGSLGGAGRSCAAHPRMRGEHTSTCMICPVVKGSSPHARGAPRCSCRLLSSHRLIPACAGSTSRPTPRSAGRRAHPRMRGEHGASGAQRSGGGGLIPACAGSTLRALMRSCSGGAHPRMRGEHAYTDEWPTNEEGSSPHARGALRAGDVHAGELGLIPACAGSTHSRRYRTPTPEAHPRMRGEHPCRWMPRG